MKNQLLMRWCLLSAIAITGFGWSYAQRVGLRTNALAWATATPNLGVELRMSRHFTFALDAYGNPLKFDKLRTQFVALQPEVRYWFSARPQAGHFLGINASGAAYKFQAKNTRHEGDAVAAGVTYGYSIPLHRRWSMEAAIGAGVLYHRDFHYGKNSERPDSPNNKKVRLAPTKLGLTFTYHLK